VTLVLLSLIAVSNSFLQRISPRIPPTTVMNGLEKPFRDMMGTMGEWMNKRDREQKQLSESDVRMKTTIPSWDEIRSHLETKQTEEERAFRSNVSKGLGQASPMNRIRLFDEGNKEEDIRVTFFRDHASWCKCLLFPSCENYLVRKV
jgi:hypothetical protein